ncbi:hypothetical protein G6F70_002154 [Rhizopus microsporus]|uniref:MICOS complex subunit mic19 n=2 Tax=Rhizopus TaxID=4842 RepID=A0A367KAW6_RHIAZ|nr:hypothetical protein G6F71_000690 [Rhizopus microsporus]RCH98981.1 hypothetical protein CU097_007960 [Rhizopus azygosporus]KAG1202591.1 hypothetical protein G6F70_002154 [Rhizopus microsporus]KAG1213267.1 hypothetical protein G6F69_002962 [Rhizopus microsporus]KAG1235229.1 hypothetical protein G6F67_002914 [Rhizopus microsporus]
MGLAQSKTQEEPIIFINPNVPVQFTPSFIHSLEKKVEQTAERAEARQVEALVRERVAEELVKMKQAEKEISQKLQVESAKSDNHQLSSLKTNDDIEGMIKNIQRTTIKEIPLEIKKHQEKVIACYNNNKDRSLDCWKEVIDFKQAVLDEQKKFVSKAS